MQFLLEIAVVENGGPKSVWDFLNFGALEKKSKSGISNRDKGKINKLV